MKIIDTHCHLNIEPYINELENYSFLLNDDNLIMNVVGTNLIDSKQAVELSKIYKNVYATVGIHPNDVDRYSIEDFNELEKMIENNECKIIAIGETGYDFYYDGYDQQKQLLFLQKHFDLALKHDLALVLHIRNAHNEIIDFLKSKNKLPRIVIHCFTGNADNVKEYVKLGCYISYSGIITFKNALEVVETIKFVPIEQILTETDSPFLTPVPFRGKLNIPSYVQYVNEKISTVLSIDINELNNQLHNNFLKCFNLK